MRYHLDHLRERQEFRFDQLVLKNIDNTPVKNFHGSEMTEIETSLFHRDVSNGDEYFEALHNFVDQSLVAGNPAPVVRFADGEYAFYAKSLRCNGLYQQAESVGAIRKAMPLHIKGLKDLSQTGKLAPVIFPGNVQPKINAFLSLLRKSKRDDSALRFIDFLFRQDIKLTRDNYVPFFVVYAYLTSKRFSEAVHGKELCIISSEFNPDLCSKWFTRFSSLPNISFVEIPDSYVATQWEVIKKGILEKVPLDTDLCLVGAGVGALLVCVDVALTYSIPAIDAGHVLNMMNGLEDKSSGPRLYTIHKEST